MSELKYAELLQLNRDLGGQLGGPPWRIRVLSNVVVNTLKEGLELALRKRGLNAEVDFGDYDNIVQGSLNTGDARAVIVMMEAANLAPHLQTRAALLADGEIQAIIDRARNEIDLVLANLAQAPLVIWNSFSALLFGESALQAGALDAICTALNSHLRAKARDNLLVADFDHAVAHTGIAHAFDSRYFYASRAPYTQALLFRYAADVAPAILAAAGLAKKVLVFDCDNTLWNGILGEDGESGIRLSDETRDGAPFAEVQRIALALRRRGVLLALCSKNNPDEVDHVLARHPDMVLRDADFAIKKVNWNDKVSNLREIAVELNLGLDSLVFVDDSGFELDFVREQLPGVGLVEVPVDRHRYPGVLREAQNLFFTLGRTTEDAGRTEMYQQEAARKTGAAKFASLEDYLRSLELALTIYVNDPALVPRIAQMTQKTNQFNLTTRRYTETEVRALFDDPRYCVIAFRVKDKFGDYGVTGLAIAARAAEPEIARLDTFLMSCRVLGRGVEKAFFDRLVALLAQRGIKRVDADYLKTAKNAQVESFYDTLGFTRKTADASRTAYTLEVADYRASGINYVGIEELHGRTG
jgi:FkbH-like protein